MAVASIQQTQDAINAACRNRGGKYAGYSCKVVSWDDASRGTVGGNLSCWGANITDTYLKSKSGKPLFTVRSDNWNEKLGQVSTKSVALLVGNNEPGGKPLRLTTLSSFLQGIGAQGTYAGLKETLDLSDESLDTQVSIRFQTTFLPVLGKRGIMEFATEAYNYNTTSDDNPKNLILLCTTQGVAVQQDGRGKQRLLHHKVLETGEIHRHWLEAERSDHTVGGPQRETAEERGDALKRGKATSEVIGIKAMGTRFNALMTVQVPLKQFETPSQKAQRLAFERWEKEEERLALERWQRHQRDLFTRRVFCCLVSPLVLVVSPFLLLCAPCLFCWASRWTVSGGSGGGLDSAEDEIPECVMMGSMVESGASLSTNTISAGVSNAARVSQGSEYDIWSGLTVGNADLQRHPSEHVTVTVVMYNTVIGGVPSEADVMSAIDDLEQLYESCNLSGHLVDNPFDFMREDLTAQEANDIATKMALHPPDNFDFMDGDLNAAEGNDIATKMALHPPVKSPA